MTTSARRRLAVVGVAVLLVAAVVVDRMPPRPRPGPARRAGLGRLVPRGALPAGATGLRLLVADVPAPFVLDVERATVSPIAGLPSDGDRAVTVVPVGDHALVLTSRTCRRCRPDAGVYLLRRGSATATALGRSSQAVPARDGRGLWLLGRQDAGRCALREVGLDGRPRRAARRVRCRTGLVAELPAGLLVSAVGAGDWHGALLRPDGAVVRLADPQARPVVGNLVLSGADRRTPLVLHDVGTGASSRLRWPSRPDYGLGEVTGDPDGRLAVVEFARYSPEHRLDLWLLDARTRRWRHLPGMPAPMAPKITDVQWTADGRVVVLSGDLLAVWRPGQPRLAIHRVPPPRRPGGRFVVW